MSPERAVVEVMGRYARAADRRDADGVANLFDADGIETVSYRNGDVDESIAIFRGHDAIRDAVTTLLPAHGSGDWAHHVTFDHLVRIENDEAYLDAQFVVYGIAQGASPVAQLTGYYDWKLRHVDGTWLIVESNIALTVPVATAAA